MLSKKKMKRLHEVLPFCITIAACWTIWCVTDYVSDNFLIIYTFVHTVLNPHIWYFNDLTVTFPCFNFWISIKFRLLKISHMFDPEYTGFDIWLKVSFLAPGFPKIFTNHNWQLWRGSFSSLLTLWMKQHKSLRKITNKSFSWIKK